MSERPVIRIYVDLYLSHTLDLSTVEHGALLLLIMKNRRNGGLPADHEVVRRWAKMTPNQWAESKDRLLGFFDAGQGRYSLADKISGAGARRRVPIALRQAVLERDGEVCAYCRTTTGPFHVDHKEPWSLGGKHDLENLCVACGACNLAKSNIPYADWLETIQ
ncbi:HNH endonuclease [Rhizobium leguminosarum]